MVGCPMRPHIISLLILAVMSAAIACFAWRRRPIVAASPFTLLMLTLTVWTLTLASELEGARPAMKGLWLKARYIGMVLVPVAWLAFVLAYTGRRRWLTPRNLLALCVISRGPTKSRTRGR